jgi:hypothetical protein
MAVIGIRDGIRFPSGAAFSTLEFYHRGKGLPMAEPAPPTTNPQEAQAPSGAPRGKEEVALELMKFIAVTTGYGRSSQTGAGFSAKPAARSPEEQAEALLELFDRCRLAVFKEA